jgi:hypothetical protein
MALLIIFISYICFISLDAPVHKTRLVHPREAGNASFPSHTYILSSYCEVVHAYAAGIALLPAYPSLILVRAL